MTIEESVETLRTAHPSTVWVSCVMAAMAIACQTPKSALPAHSTEATLGEDFATLVRTVSDNYAYLDQKATRWQEIPRLYQTDLERVSNREQWIRLLEQVVDELYDAHAHLSVNLPNSRRLVPSGSDLWAEWHTGQAVITEVRPSSDAERAGIRAGCIVLEVGGRPIESAVESVLGRSYAHNVPEARAWGLRAVLAGQHDRGRTLELAQCGGLVQVELAAGSQLPRHLRTLSAREVLPGIGCIELHDSLGDSELVPAFDHALAELAATKALVLDLRDTPSGGNSAVARGILSRFVSEEAAYQKHVVPSEERETGVRRSFLELVTPRGPFRYAGRVVVVVSRFTGSMGEGLAIGFDATRAGTVIGTEMAGLLGATEHFELPHSKVGINLPVERLYHVDGTPRERFVPHIQVDPRAPRSGEWDAFMAKALAVASGG